VQLRQRHNLKVPDAIILATARCAELNLLPPATAAISPSRWAACCIHTSSDDKNLT
jgi:hypothetical protein